MGFLTCAITGVLHPEDIPELEKEWKKIVDGLESAGYTDRSGSEEFGWKLECIERTIAWLQVGQKEGHVCAEDAFSIFDPVSASYIGARRTKFLM